MKGFHKTLMIATFFITSTVGASEVSVSLSQKNSSFDITLQPDQAAIVHYDLRRYPVTRASEWVSFVVRCRSSEQAMVEYNTGTDGSKTKSHLPIILSHFEAEMLIGKEILEQGSFSIKNESNITSLTECNLYKKPGF